MRLQIFLGPEANPWNRIVGGAFLPRNGDLMTKRFSVLNTLLIVSLVAFLTCVLTIVLAARAEARFRDQASQAFDVMQVLDGIIVNALNAETGQRGYFLTGDEDYLDPYRVGMRDVVGHIDTFREMAGDEITPAQAEKLARLDTATRVKVGELQSSMQLFQDGKISAALDLVRTDAGKAAMDEIRETAGLLIAEEQALLTAGRNEAQRARVLVLLCVTLLVFVSMFGFVLALRNLGRAQKLGLVEEQARQLGEERERTDLLARELNHRVKNLFAIVQSIISSTSRQETDARVAATKIRERVFALSRAHALTSSIDMQQQTTLAELVQAIVASQVKDHCDLHMDGPPVTVMAQHVTPIGMILHELTTNALKYGAGSCDGGLINVTWTINKDDPGQELKISWQEICAKDVDLSAPGPDGFGSRMMAISLTQLRGRSERRWAEDGLNMDILLPLDDHGAVKDRNKAETQ